MSKQLLWEEFQCKKNIDLSTKLVFVANQINKSTRELACLNKNSDSLILKNKGIYQASMFWPR